MVHLQPYRWEMYHAWLFPCCYWHVWRSPYIESWLMPEIIWRTPQERICSIWWLKRLWPCTTGGTILISMKTQRTSCVDKGVCLGLLLFVRSIPVVVEWCSQYGIQLVVFENEHAYDAATVGETKKYYKAVLIWSRRHQALFSESTKHDANDFGSQ